jgi:beta-xylosidase
MISSSGSGGAIDASGFKDTDGSIYIVYKIDGNSLSPGGPCGNPGPDYRPTPIMLVPVQSDGVTPSGPAIQVLDRDANDGPLIEAPSLVRMGDGTYTIFFSSNCWDTTYYDVTWASAPTVTGPYTKYGPLLVTSSGGLTAPGGATASSDGQHLVFHANLPSGGRAMYGTLISGSGSAIQYTS